MANSKPNPNAVQRLFQAAADEGNLSQEVLTQLSIPDLGAQIQAGLGVSPDDVPASEVVLVTQMPDDSGSIQHGNNARLVCEGHNLVLDALLASKQRDSILAHTRYLNGSILFPYRPIAQAVRMDKNNYDPNLSTPLYDQTMVLLGTVLAKSQELAQAGVQARTVTLILTDGGDCVSTRFRAKDVKRLVRDMLKMETHVVCAMGLADGTTHFRDVFREMGIEDRWILTPGTTAAEVRKAFAIFSQSAVRASQSAQAFGQASLGGFAGP
jgi:hypothetical protein